MGDYPEPRHECQGARTCDPVDLNGFDVFCAGVMASITDKPVNKWQYWNSVFKDGDTLMDDHDTRVKGIASRDYLPEGPWLAGFPHVHGWTTGRTIIMGIQAPESGGELVIYPDESDEPLMTWAPTPGVGVVLPDKSLMHGVRPVVGDRERIVLICTAFRKEDR